MGITILSVVPTLSHQRALTDQQSLCWALERLTEFRTLLLWVLTPKIIEECFCHSLKRLCWLLRMEKVLVSDLPDFASVQMNDGPLCKCSAKARRTGIRHSIYPGEEV